MSMLTGMPHVWQQIVLPSSQPFDTGLGLKHMVPTLPLWALTSSKSALFILYAGYLLIVPTSSNTSTALSPAMGAPNSFCVAVYPDVLGQNALPKRIFPAEQRCPDRIACNGSAGVHDDVIQLLYSADQTLQQLNHEAIDMQGMFVDMETIIQVNASDDYVVGFQALNPVSMHVTGIIIEEMSAVDLAAIDINGPDIPLLNVETSYNVNVANKGYSTIEAYDVDIIDEAGHVLGTARVDEPIAPQQCHTAAVNWTPTATGNQRIAARVQVSGDNNDNNDQTDFIDITVFDQGSWLDLKDGHLFSSDAPFNLMATAQCRTDHLPEGLAATVTQSCADHGHKVLLQ